MAAAPENPRARQCLKNYCRTKMFCCQLYLFLMNFTWHHMLLSVLHGVGKCGKCDLEKPNKSQF